MSSPAVAGEIDRLAGSLAHLIAALPPTVGINTVALLISEVSRRVQELSPTSAPIAPELLDWANRLDTDEEITTGLCEIRKTGGHSLDDFYGELEEAAQAHG